MKHATCWSRVRSRPAVARTTLACALVLLSGVAPAARPNELSVPIVYSPKADLSELLKAGPLPFGSSLAVAAIEDGRQGPPDYLGENREESTPVRVRCQGPVAPLVARAVSDVATKAGVRVDAGATLSLAGRLEELEVVESSRYHGSARISFELRDASGAIVWSGQAEGKAERFGRSLKPENYNETLSDTLLSAAAALFSNPEFLARLTGQPATAAGTEPGTATPVSGSRRLTPDAAKAELLELKSEGFDEQTLIQFVSRLTLAPLPSSADLVEWKKAGLSQAVIRAAVSGGSEASPTGQLAAAVLVPPKSTDRAVPELGGGFGTFRWRDRAGQGLTEIGRKGKATLYSHEGEVRIGQAAARRVVLFFGERGLYRVELRFEAGAFSGIVTDLERSWGRSTRLADGQSRSWSRSAADGETAAELHDEPSGPRLDVFDRSLRRAVEGGTSAKDDL